MVAGTKVNGVVQLSGAGLLVHDRLLTSYVLPFRCSLKLFR